MTSPVTDINTCACGCGTEIGPDSQWARGHFHRGRAENRVQPIPGPEDEIDLDGILDMGEVPDPGAGTGAGKRPGGDFPPWDDLPPDEPPIDLGKPKDRPPRGKAPKVAAGLRRDIDAKITIQLMIGGKIWVARDPICGGVFVAQVPPTADALTDIVCQSSDLVEWFTSTGGGFMLYLNLGAALLPVVQVVGAHHVFHTIGPAPEQAQPDMAQYAA